MEREKLNNGYTSLKLTFAGVFRFAQLDRIIFLVDISQMQTAFRTVSLSYDVGSCLICHLDLVLRRYPSTMQRNQWTAAYAQLLRHWGRSGIQQVPGSTPQSITRAADWLVENTDSFSEEALIEQRPQEPSTMGSDLEATASIADPVVLKKESEPALNVALLSARTTTTPASTSAAAVSIGDGEWSSRSLSVEDRQMAFNSLNEQVILCRKCEDIVCRRQRTVFGIGSVNARVVMFGEAPGAEEDRVGEPFVGPAGELLDKILLASGLKRPEVYILNALKCRPPNNRTPTDSEIENCRPFFEAQLETIQPEFIVCWGAVAVRAVLGSTESIGRLRGRFHSYRGAKVLVTYHPAYLLRTPDAKKLTWEDMKMLMREMGAPIPVRN